MISVYCELDYGIHIVILCLLYRIVLVTAALDVIYDAPAYNWYWQIVLFKDAFV